MADYPTVGAGWVKNLVEASFVTAGVAGNPACSIYEKEGDCSPSANIYCRCNGYTKKQDVALIKTHFPAQELFKQQSCKDDQYHRSLQYDKVLRVVRHPARIIQENADRFGGQVSELAVNLVCYASWWDQVANYLGSENVLIVRYEDLCQQTADTLLEILQFFGGSAATIPKTTLEKLSKNATLSCEYSADDILLQSEWDPSRPDIQAARDVIIDNKEVFQNWNYDLHEKEPLMAAQNRPKKSLRTTNKLPVNPHRERPEEPNPWASVW